MNRRDAILAKASPEPNTGCWLWTLGDNGRGYGRVKYNGRQLQAHRLFYEFMVGPIPEGLELDHKCRVTFCVNPDHLEPVPHKENVRRGSAADSVIRRQRSKTHCPYGHEYAGANLVIRSNGSRACKSCIDARSRSRPARNRIKLSHRYRVITGPDAPRSKSGHLLPTHCKRGHSLSGPDVKVSGNLRICLICRRMRDKEKHRRRKERLAEDDRRSHGA